MYAIGYDFYIALHYTICCHPTQLRKARSTYIVYYNICLISYNMIYIILCYIAVYYNILIVYNETYYIVHNTMNCIMLFCLVTL